MPVRKVPMNYRNVTGRVASAKAIGAAEVESTLERDFITLLEFRQDVKKFEVQPVKIEWKDENDKTHTYTPDVLVFFNKHHRGDERPVLFEVKYRSELREKFSILLPKFKSANKYANEQGWRFRVITERIIRTPRVKNAKFLLPYQFRDPVDEEQMNIVDNVMRKLITTTPRALLSAITEDRMKQAELMPTLWYLVGTFQIGIDLNEAITMESRIWSLYK
jgi:hypothetical protein